MNALLWFAVGGLGGLGAIGRFWLDATVSARVRRGLPFGTLAVNLSGAFVLGLLVGVSLEGRAYLLAGTALLGSYTTFSTWMLESHRLGEDGQTRMLAVNVVLSLTTGLGAAALGRALGGLL